MQPYLRKFHTFHEPSEQVREHLSLDYLDPASHGTSGPVQVSYGNYHTDRLNAAWPATFAALGKKSKVDPCSGRALGAVSAPGTVSPETWTRSWAAGAYLTPEVRQRPNLHITTNAHVEKVIIDGTIVKGVVYRDADGQTHSMNGREVVLCGGVFNSPQILELSGIGSKSILEQHNIPVIVDIPGVGENLQDHSNVGVSFEATIETFDSFRDPAKIGAVFKQYQDDRSGPMANGIFCMAFMPYAGKSSGSGQDDGDLAAILHRHVQDSSIEPGLRKQYELIRRTVNDPGLSSVQYLAAPVQLDKTQSGGHVPEDARLADYITLFASLSHPFSRGSCHITSSKPGDYPAVDPKYFSHPADVELLSRHLQYLGTIAETKPLADLLKPKGRTIPVDLDLQNLDYVKNKLIKSGFTTYHPCGTCAMMPRESKGVVDENLKVYGVSGLRVVDASVFPLIPRGNIQSVVYTLAERAADIIKEEIGKLQG